MSHKSKMSLPAQVFAALEGLARYGHSRHQDKQEGVSGRYIYSYGTMKSYKKHCLLFIRWCRERLPERLGRAPRTLEECRPYVAEWLLERQAAGCSPCTCKLERSALSKLYGEPIEVQLSGMSRSLITRSRGRAVRDAHFSEENNADLINFCRCAGPRRAELESLDASALVWVDGRPFIHYAYGTKGGRERLSPLVGSEEEVARALAFLGTLTGRNHVHGSADVHSFRADYATRVYKAHLGDLKALHGQTLDYTALTGKRAPDGSRIVKSALYFCRGDRAGLVLDRAAMIAASKALGHNRESVVGEHYLRL